VERAVSTDAWVVDGSYAEVGDIVLARATTVVWLDFPRRVVMPRVTRRSLRRLVTRQELWNGNRARLRSLVGPDHAIRAAWSRHESRRADYAARLACPEHAHVDVRRFTSPRLAARWLDTFAG
jgi:hypothetical protein